MGLVAKVSEEKSQNFVSKSQSSFREVAPKPKEKSQAGGCPWCAKSVVNVFVDSTLEELFCTHNNRHCHDFSMKSQLCGYQMSLREKSFTEEKDNEMRHFNGSFHNGENFPLASA
jgi:hypothetical protein